MAATAFCIKQHAMVLGYASDTLAAAALQVLPPEPVYLNWCGETLAAAFVFAPVPEQPFSERLLDLLASFALFDNDPARINDLEAQFKAVARALRDAVALDSRVTGIPSTKGSL